MVQAERQGRLAIVAGGGNLPIYLANAARQAGDEPVIFPIENESTADWSAYDSVGLSIGDIRGFHEQCRKLGVGRIVLSGSVRVRPSWRDVRLSIRTLWRLPALLTTLLSGGDNRVLSTAIGLLEEGGLKVVGAQDIAPDLVATIGPLGRVAPDQRAWKDIKVAVEAARLLGKLDVGQAAIGLGGRVVALEGPEGTDSMIGRIEDLRRRERVPANRPGVLVKLCKPGQDLRVDLPSAGLSTIENAFRVGLAGVALEAGRSLLLDRESVISFADAHGMFVVGIDPDAPGDMP